MATLRALLALEIARILADLEARRELLVALWSLHRDRWPQLELAHSRWRTLRQPQLDALSPEEIQRIDAFYEALEDWRHYARTTEDMPRHLDWAWRQHHARLVATGRRALDLLGPPPAVEPPANDRDGRSFLEAFALTRPGARPTRPAPREGEE